MLYLRLKETVDYHRKMWKWIAEETLKRRKKVFPDDYFKYSGIKDSDIPEYNSYCCDYGLSVIDKSIQYDYQVFGISKSFKYRLSIRECKILCPFVWTDFCPGSKYDCRALCEDKSICGCKWSLYHKWLYSGGDWQGAAEKALAIANLDLKPNYQTVYDQEADSEPPKRYHAIYLLQDEKRESENHPVET